MAEEGGGGRSGGTRGSVRGAQQEEVHRARDAPEPPDFQDASCEGRRGIRFLQPRSSRYSLRRVSLRTPSSGGGPTRTPTRFLLARGFSDTLPRGLCRRRIVAVAS